MPRLPPSGLSILVDLHRRREILDWFCREKQNGIEPSLTIRAGRSRSSRLSEVPLPEDEKRPVRTASVMVLPRSLRFQPATVSPAFGPLPDIIRSHSASKKDDK